jgi:hypothetical protein
VGVQKRLFGAGIRRRALSPSEGRPYNIRVRRNHGGGLWTFEADDGQLYLAVKSREANQLMEARDEEKARQGLYPRGA